MPQFTTSSESDYYLQSQRILALAAAIQALSPHAEIELQAGIRNGVADRSLTDAIRQMKQKLLFD